MAIILENKKNYKYSFIDKNDENARKRKYESAIDWLVASKLILINYKSKRIAPKYGELGLNRIRKIVEYAKKFNVKVAFENTKIKGYLEYVLENIKDDNVGICFDLGLDYYS